MGGMVTIFDPDGNKGEIPYENLSAAVKAGAKPAVTVKSPDGTLGDIPADRLPDAAKAGATVVPIEQQENQHPGFWQSMWGDVSGMAKGAIQTAGAVAQSAASGNPAPMAPLVAATAQNVSDNMQHRVDEKRSLAYRTVAPVGDVLGVNTRGMEDAADQGDVAGVAGHAAAVPAVMAATYGLAKGVSAINDALPSAARAGSALQEVKSVAGDIPIDTSKVGDSALELYTQSQRGATLPPAVNKLVQRLTKPGSDPITYAEAKDFQSNISNLSANEKMNLKPNQVRLLGQLNSALKDSLTDAADTVGKGQQFQQAMREYHDAMKLKGYSDATIDAAWKAAAGAAGLGAAAKLWSSMHQ